MEVTQIYELVNAASQAAIGETAILNEDLSNLVDVGTALFNANAVDNYVRSLTDHVGKMVFVDRVYRGTAPSVLMDGWEFGSVLEKVRGEMPEATENESWELEDGQSYDPNIFYKPVAKVKFFNKRVTFEIPMSFTERQVKSSFSNATQMMAFISMLRTQIENSLTVKTDELIRRVINAGIGETLYAEHPDGTYTGVSGVRAINVLKEFNDANGTTLTVAQAKNKDNAEAFSRFWALTMKNTIDRMHNMSKIYNIGETAKFTPADRMKVVLLSEIKNMADVYLENGVGQFKTENIQMPNADIVSYWQGSGEAFDFDDASSINIKTPSGHTVEASGIIGVIFDRDALGVANLDRRVTTNYNPKAEFFNEWHKFDAGYFLDMDENFVVFYMA